MVRAQSHSDWNGGDWDSSSLGRLGIIWYVYIISCAAFALARVQGYAASIDQTLLGDGSRSFIKSSRSEAGGLVVRGFGSRSGSLLERFWLHAPT